jgi:RNA polymerase sigma factor (sigma-70 family)
MSRGQLITVLRHIRTAANAQAVGDGTDAELLAAFAASQDHAAFTALVHRHGPMVLRVCRHVLHHEQDAEDAFQATFLVLARKAASVRKKRAVVSWLHGVAYRVAMNAKRNAARGRQHERHAHVASPDDPVWQAAWREVQALVEDELRRLPEKWRSAFLLCYVEGRSRAEAAGLLGISPTTVRTRLSKARRQLRARLARPGVALPTVLAALAVAEAGPAAGIRSSLFVSTIAGARLFAVGRRVEATGISTAAVALAQGVVKAMLVTKLKLGVILLAVLGLAAVGWTAHRAPPAPPVAEVLPGVQRAGAQGPPEQATAKTDTARATFTYSGRVLDPAGKPLAGAKLLLTGLTPGVIEFRARATSGPDGTFRFTVRRDEFGDKGVIPQQRSPPERHVEVAATADGCGAVCVWAGKPEEREALTLWLPAEEVIRGSVIDLEGRPVAGVHVGVNARYTRADKNHKPLPYDALDEPGQFTGNLLPEDSERTTAVTGKDGRFVLRGLSRGWIYDLFFWGPTVVNARAQLVARPQAQAVVGASGEAPPDRPLPQVPLYGNTLTHVAAPCKPIVGVVRDKASGRPLAGVGVSRPWTRDDDPYASTTTDKEGKYRLTGLPRGIHKLKVEPPRNTPYLATEVRVTADQPSLEPVTFDIGLERQPTVTGRVIDRATGKPVKGWVEYRPLAGNPNLKANLVVAGLGPGSHPPSVAIDDQGRFTLPALRGRGVVLVQAEGGYLPAQLAKTDRVAGVADQADPELIDSLPLPAWPATFHAYRLLNLSEGNDANIEITLAPGGVRPLVLTFPDGKPRDTTVLGLNPVASDPGAWFAPGKSAVVSLAAGEVRRVFLMTHDGQFAATAVVRGQETGAVSVQMKPVGTITGRVVDKDGRPVAGVSLQPLYDDGPGRPGVFALGGSVDRLRTPAEDRRKVRTTGYYDPRSKDFFSSEKTDAQGRFCLTGVLADAAFDLNVQLLGPADAKGRRSVAGVVKIARVTVQPGATLELGDLRAAAPTKK